MKSPKFTALVVASAISAILFIGASMPRTPLNNAFLQGDLDGNQKCILNLLCLTATTITATNINTTTINGGPVNNFSGGNVNMLEVFNMKTNLVLQGPTNRYWLDLAHTNGLGAVDIYATLTPTNDAQFELPTNGFRGGVLSFNVLARGANRVLFFPTNFAAFNTNDAGFVLAGSRYVLTLTNGNEARISFQSNDTYSVMTKTFGQ